MDNSDKSWHLSRTEEESEITELELQLWRSFSAFMRWVEECERIVNGSNLTGHDLVVLHIIAMRDRPKSITDIGKILNRTDNFNLQYTVKKLIKMGLITKIESSPNYTKSSLYRITEKGVENTQAYSQARRKILINMHIKGVDLNFSEITKSIIQLKSIYDDAAQAATLYLDSDLKEENKKTSKIRGKKTK